MSVTIQGTFAVKPLMVKMPASFQENSITKQGVEKYAT